VDAKLGTSQRRTIEFCLLADFQWMSSFYWDYFCEKAKLQTWRAGNAKIHILFYGDNS
jgi:hypothetical protein